MSEKSLSGFLNNFLVEIKIRKARFNNLTFLILINVKAGLV